MQKTSQNMTQHLSREDGFTLSELLVVVGLLGIVLASAWAGLYGIRMGDDIARQEGQAAIAFADPLEEMSKILMQNTSIKSTASNRIEAWTDRDLDGQPELNSFYLDGDGQLVWDWALYNTARTAVQKQRSWVMTEHTANVGTGNALFTYIKRDGTALSGTDIGQKGPSDTVFVRVRLDVDLHGRTESDTREIAFRTRS